MKQPVPPWTSETIVQLKAYLSLSLAQLARLAGIKPSVIYLWAKGEAPQLSADELAGLAAFEKEIPALRYAALTKAEERTSSERRQQKYESFDAQKICFLTGALGFTQAEIATIFGVSYDTAVSWCNFRRRVFKETHIDAINALVESFMPCLHEHSDTQRTNTLFTYLAQGGVSFSPPVAGIAGNFIILGEEDFPALYSINLEKKCVTIQQEKDGSDLKIITKFPVDDVLVAQSVKIRQNDGTPERYQIVHSSNSDFICGCVIRKKKYLDLIVTYRGVSSFRFLLGTDIDV